MKWIPGPAAAARISSARRPVMIVISCTPHARSVCISRSRTVWAPSFMSGLKSPIREDRPAAEIKASVDEQGETALSIVPATSSAGYTRELDVEKKEAFYQKIQGLSDGVQIDENGKVQVQ